MQINKRIMEKINLNYTKNPSDELYENVFSHFSKISKKEVRNDVMNANGRGDFLLKLMDVIEKDIA